MQDPPNSAFDASTLFHNPHRMSGDGGPSSGLPPPSSLYGTNQPHSNNHNGYNTANTNQGPGAGGGGMGFSSPSQFGNHHQPTTGNAFPSNANHASSSSSPLRMSGPPFPLPLFSEPPSNPTTTGQGTSSTMPPLNLRQHTSPYGPITSGGYLFGAAGGSGAGGGGGAGGLSSGSLSGPHSHMLRPQVTSGPLGPMVPLFTGTPPAGPLKPPTHTPFDLKNVLTNTTDPPRPARGRGRGSRGGSGGGGPAAAAAAAAFAAAGRGGADGDGDAGNSGDEAADAGEGVVGTARRSARGGSRGGRRGSVGGQGIRTGAAVAGGGDGVGEGEAGAGGPRRRNSSVSGLSAALAPGASPVVRSKNGGTSKFRGVTR